jgi:hypothetical protein
MRTNLAEPRDVLFRIKRGLAAYVSYLAACEMNAAFSEYVLYEPILRIFTARQYSVECEYECPGITHAQIGDKKRLDFVATGHGIKLAIEVKWIKSHQIKISTDVEKLAAFKKTFPDSHGLLILFGRQTQIADVQVQLAKLGFKERGTALYADLRLTKYGCRIFEFQG